MPETTSEPARTARARLGVPRRLRLPEDEADRRAVLGALYERTYGLERGTAEVLRETLERAR